MTTYNEIKKAVDNGLDVRCDNDLYQVLKDRNGYYIYCSQNDYCIGLKHKSSNTLNGVNFYIKESE
jgi:hypothetical protein